MIRQPLKLNLSWILLAIVVLPTAAHSQHQTSTFSPIELNPSLPFHIQLKEYDFGSGELPGLHSYAAGRYDGKWVLLAGRTNGVHDLDQSGIDSFPAESQNRDVWVIDPVAKQSWHRSLGDPAAPGTNPSSGLNAAQIASLTPTNNQFAQRGNRLYVSGGYGLNPAGSFTTFDTLTAIDLPGLVNWVQTGSGQAVDYVRQLTSATASVTGGAMYEMDGRFHLVFGQDFEGEYSPRTDGAYTRQVRSFDIVDDGTNLALANVTQSTPVATYRRRDLNVVPFMRPDGLGGTKEGLVALSGVFTSSFGAWTVPVEIDSNVNPTMANPALADTFKQGFNGYHSAKIGLYSEASGSMHEVLMGGISVQYLDESTGMVQTDNAMPFVNDVTAVSIDATGIYSQQHLGFYPELNDDAGNRWRFGANAEFFLADGVQTFENGVIKLDSLAAGTRLGYVFGGIMSNGPHTRGLPDVTSTASFRIFEVVYSQVPEPSTLPILVLGGLVGTQLREPRILSRRFLEGGLSRGLAQA